jgi:hypothetical protein
VVHGVKILQYQGYGKKSTKEPTLKNYKEAHFHFMVDPDVF